MKKSVSIIGGGPSALMLASKLDEAKFDVTIHEKNKTLGRKFLVAGKGGFNLTHSESIDKMVKRYTPSTFLEDAVIQFDNVHLTNWLKNTSIPTFIGSSKRIYPKDGIKPIEVLNSILKRIITKGVEINYESEWKDWNDESVRDADIVVFALGGGSWKITGSEGDWLQRFEAKGITTIPFQASNCAFEVDWEEDFIMNHEGSPLKNIAISCNDIKQQGEVVITKFGIEGNAIYALSPEIRKQLSKNGKANVFLDLKPMLSEAVILNKIKCSSHRNKSDVLRNDLRLSNAQLALLKEHSTKEEFTHAIKLTKKIKAVRLEINNTDYLDKAISTVGGVSLDSVDGSFQLKALKNHYCIGEMLDWDAPTGGYLLQACFSMGAHLATHLNQRVLD